MQNNMHDMQNMQMLFPICRICTAHFGDECARRRASSSSRPQGLMWTRTSRVRTLPQVSRVFACAPAGTAANDIPDSRLGRLPTIPGPPVALLALNLCYTQVKVRYQEIGKVTAQHHGIMMDKKQHQHCFSSESAHFVDLRPGGCRTRRGPT